MPASLSKIVSIAAIGALSCASALANPVHIRDGMAVDRAGNTFVPPVGVSQPDVEALLNASGPARHVDSAHFVQ